MLANRDYLEEALIAKKMKAESRETVTMCLTAGRSDKFLGRQDRTLVASIRTAVITGTTSGKLARTLRLWGKLWSVPELPDITRIRHNTRLRRTIARWVVESHTVELSTRFFDRQHDQREILCHELAHAAVVTLRGRSERPHGSAWCQLLREAGYEPKTHLVSARRIHAAATAERSPLVYEHRCPVCHAVRYGKRSVKSWRCAECVGAGLSGNLIVAAMPVRAAIK